MLARTTQNDMESSKRDASITVTVGNITWMSLERIKEKENENRNQ